MGQFFGRLFNLLAFPMPVVKRIENRKAVENVTKFTIQLDCEHTINGCIHGEITAKTKFICIYSYGNQESMYDIEEKINYKMEKWFNKSMPFVVYDYPGYGFHEKAGILPNNVKAVFEKVMVTDLLHNYAAAVFDYIDYTYNRNHDKQYVLWGRSIGSVAACYLIHTRKKRNVCLTIIESGVASVFSSRFLGRFPFEFFPSGWDVGNNRMYAHEDRNWGKVVFIYGADDEVVVSGNTDVIARELENQQNVNIVRVPKGKHNLTMDELQQYLIEGQAATWNNLSLW